MRKPPDTFHLTRGAAGRARRRWLRSRRGRDAYVHRRNGPRRWLRWRVSYIDYDGPRVESTTAQRIG